MNELTESRSTWYPHRFLTRSESLLLLWLGENKEREAIALARIIGDLPADVTEEEIETRVTLALCTAHSAIHGNVEVEYVSGQRRDSTRERIVQ